MRILIVRHGDPNYELDTLTETGWKEARLVAEYLAKFNIAAFYVSPLGRAQDTAKCTLEKMNRKAETFDWLQEFPAHIHRPGYTGSGDNLLGLRYRRIWKKITHIMIETTGARRTLCVQKM